MSDGGEGFGDVMAKFLGARKMTARTVDAARRPCAVSWWWHASGRTAIVESARVVGLAMLPRAKFHPFELDTRGLAAVFQAAARKGATRCLVGIGGSATNDGGFGLARALGWQFRDSSNQEIQRWPELDRLSKIDPPKTRQLFKQLIVAVDVQNPLLGPKGATRIYGPQKGIRPADFASAEACLRRMAKIWQRQFHSNLHSEPGAGAAGGLGFGLLAFLSARLAPGFALFARYAKLEKHVRSSDFVITGEGAIDESTLMGKGVGQLAAMCRQYGVPCLGLAGIVNRSRKLNLFSQVHSLTEIAGQKEAQTKPALYLEILSSIIARTAAILRSD